MKIICFLSQIFAKQKHQLYNFPSAYTLISPENSLKYVFFLAMTTWIII